MKNLQIENTQFYELIDSGNFEKLERFGQYIIARPEPQALWNKSLSDAEWKKMAHAFFICNKDKDKKQTERGEWSRKAGMPENWNVSYVCNDIKIKMQLRLTSFSHVGVFPEQAANWDYIYNWIKNRNELTTVLNLFAYTGIASVVAKAAGADVTHVDAVKPMINWARENMLLSGLENIRWVVEDALKFVKREVKRGKKYQGIILDPPAYGRGPEGEKWVLEEGIRELLSACKVLLDEKHYFFILNMYSLGYSPFIAENLLTTIFSNEKQIEYGEFFFQDKFLKNLPLGIYCRFKS